MWSDPPPFASMGGDQPRGVPAALALVIFSCVTEEALGQVRPRPPANRPPMASTFPRKLPLTTNERSPLLLAGLEFPWKLTPAAVGSQRL